MDFELNETHKLIRETTRRVAREVVAPRAAEIDETEEYPQDVFDAYRELGLLGISMPEQYGGSGAGILGLALAIEEVAKYCCSSGLILMLSALGTRPILIGGTEEQKQRWITPVARGELRASFSLSEPGAGSDAANLQTRAVRDGDYYVLNGEKSYVSGGTKADYCVVFAKTDPSAGGRGISAFIVPTDTPGYTIARVNPKMGVKGMQIANFSLQDVRVPKENLVGGVEGRGLNHALMGLNCVRPLVGARGLGLAEGAMNYALDFARERRAFGGPIIDLQAIQFMFADMAIAIESARLLVYQASLMVDQGRYQRHDAPYLSIAKTVASEAAVKVSSDAMQVLGAQGYLKDHPLERHYRDARQLMIVEGTSQIQRVIIARALMERDLVYA
ncbi:MAG TPA: acyl-CoA dehydrogenase family protein [Dehalococcoidia bacterium]|nr:acyl-CoA dehydrogenase family protein [Dehalococcoidia bacterium]